MTSVFFLTCAPVVVKGHCATGAGHERETCLSSFQHSLKRVFELCRYFQTASQRCNPQELMGQAALALGQWGTKASRMGCGLAGIYFSVPGKLCSGARANISAEVSCHQRGHQCSSRPAKTEGEMHEPTCPCCGSL